MHGMAWQVRVHTIVLVASRPAICRRSDDSRRRETFMRRTAGGGDQRRVGGDSPGLGLGADDYIVKSVTPAEVVARVEAVLRRSSAGRDLGRRLRFGSLEVDLAAHEVHVAGRLVRMTAREFELLRVFVQHPRQVFSREHLFGLLWGSHGDRSAVSV
jgi:DNA-binding response OmpR family regulator